MLTVLGTKTASRTVDHTAQAVTATIARPVLDS